jgi:hypothetical protein
MEKQHINKSILLAIFILILAGLLSTYFKNPHPNNQPTICTQEAKLCPDGSYVGRIGPKCEFAACPQIELHTYQDPQNKFSFQYADFPQKQYMGVMEWPPKVTITTPSSCGASSTQKIIGDKTFCVSEISEGAAGTIYTTYHYRVVLNNKLVTFEFTLRLPQCYNYDNPKQTECFNEEKSFDVDSLMIPIATTLTFSM